MAKYVRTSYIKPEQNKVSAWSFTRHSDNSGYPAPKEVFAYNKKIANLSIVFMLFKERQIKEDALFESLFKQISSVKKASCKRLRHPVGGEYFELFILLNKGNKRKFILDVNLDFYKSIDKIINLKG